MDALKAGPYVLFNIVQFLKFQVPCNAEYYIISKKANQFDYFAHIYSKKRCLKTTAGLTDFYNDDIVLSPHLFRTDSVLLYKL